MDTIKYFDYYKVADDMDTAPLRIARKEKSWRWYGREEEGMLEEWNVG